MNRKLLGALIVLGVITTALGGFGVFAAFTDTVPTGTNSLTSAERANVASLQIAIVDGFDVRACSTAVYAHETTTPFYEFTTYGGEIRERIFCLRNVGTASLTVGSAVRDLTATDPDCTGDEPAVDDTCGKDGPGELQSVLQVTHARIPACDPGAAFQLLGGPLDPEVLTDWGTVGPGEVACGWVRVRSNLDATEEQLQAAQTDRVTWRFIFTATAGT
jgi:hypothetical protein